MIRAALILIMAFIIALMGCNGTDRTTGDIPSDSGKQRRIRYSEQREGTDISISILAGEVLNREYYPHIKSINLEIPDFPGNLIVHSCPIGDDGTFRIEFQPLQPRDVSIYPLLENIFISPGDSLHITINFADIRNVSFSGDRAELNRHISDFLKSYYVEIRVENPMLEPAQFQRHCDSVRAKNIALRDKYLETNNPGSDFQLWTQKMIDVDYYRNLIDYPINRPMSRNIQWSLSDNYYDFIKTISDVYETGPLYSGVFTLAHQYLVNYSQLKTIMNMSNGERPDVSVIIEDIREEFSYAKLNQYLLSCYFHNYFQQNSLTEYHKYLSDYNSINDPFLRQSLDNHLERTREYIENPKKRSDEIVKGNEFDAQERQLLNGDRNILDSIILKNSGRNVYAYFWASWCPPCKQDIPLFNDLMRKYKEDNIEFVFVCIDINPVRESIVASSFAGGTHYLCTESESNTLGKKFNFFNGIPYALLINKEGLIIDYGNHVRPGNSATISKMEEMLR